MNSPGGWPESLVSTTIWSFMAESKKNALAAAIADLRAASAQMRAANGKPPTTKKVGKNARKRAARRAAKAALSSTNGSVSFAAPVAQTRMLRQSRAQIATSSNGQVAVISHREYVAEVPGATNWTTTSYVIQPALQQLFVWLAKVAGNYEKYRFRRLRFCYETESPSSQAGSVVLAIDYDALDVAPASKQDALSYKSAVRTAPWQAVYLDCDLSRDAQRDLLFTRSGSVPSGADQKLYDLGKLHVGVQNSSGSTGELWVEYVVELHTPQPNTQPISGTSTGTTSLTASALVGADATFATGSNVGWTLTSASTFTCSISGSYVFVVTLAGTVLAATALTNSGTATQLSLPVPVCNPNGAATNAVGYALVTAQVGQTYIPAITSATTVTTAVWHIAPYNAALL